MPTVTLSLHDTAGGGLHIESDYTPHVGTPCSPAQGVALNILARTRREWGLLPAHARAAETPADLCRALLDPEDLGHAVPQDVRQRAKNALWGPAA